MLVLKGVRSFSQEKIEGFATLFGAILVTIAVTIAAFLLRGFVAPFIAVVLPAILGTGLPAECGKTHLIMKPLSAPWNKTGFFPLVLPLLGEITERESRGGRSFSRNLLARDYYTREIIARFAPIKFGLNAGPDINACLVSSGKSEH